VWGLLKAAMRDGIDIPGDPELEQDLTGPEYYFTHRSGHDVIRLESKQDMKTRGLASPDCGDVLAMSYAVKVAPVGGPRVEIIKEWGAGDTYSGGDPSTRWMRK
jgi:hypothetical protein